MFKQHDSYVSPGVFGPLTIYDLCRKFIKGICSNRMLLRTLLFKTTRQLLIFLPIQVEIILYYSFYRQFFLQLWKQFWKYAYFMSFWSKIQGHRNIARKNFLFFFNFFLTIPCMWDQFLLFQLRTESAPLLK